MRWSNYVTATGNGREENQMSDTTATPVAAPITIDPSAAKPAPVATAPPENEKPSWLDARLERERAKALKDAGFESAEDAKKASEELKAKREAEKSAAQKAAELEAALKTKTAREEALTSTLSGYAKTQLAGLTEAQRNAVAAVAGDDPAKQLQTIEALKPTWASASAPATPAPVVPKDTAPAAAAPKDAGNVSAPDLKAVYEELVKTNPVLAARFRAANGLYEK
jgi:hypothetical protein